MSRDVSNHDAHVRAVEDDKVVKVAGHRSHGDVARRYVEACYRRHGFWQDGLLDLPSGLQFFLNRVQLLRKLFLNAAEYEMGVHASLHHGRGKRFVDIIHGADIEATGFIFSFSLPGETASKS